MRKTFLTFLIMVGIFYPLINSFAEPASQSIPFFTNYVIPTGMIDIDYVLGADNNSDISTKITRLFQKKIMVYI